MNFLFYFLIVACAGTQSATTKLYNRQAGNPAVFNAIKASAALVLFALMAAVGFTFHLPTMLFGLAYGTCLSISMHAGYKALCLGPMALTSMLASFSVVIPLLWGVTVGGESVKGLQWVAFGLLIFAILMTNADKLRRKERAERGYALWLIYLLITFLTNGLCSVIQKEHQTLYPEAYSREFMLFAVLLCAIVFTVIALFQMPRRAILASKGKGWGVLSGTCNGLANFFTLVLAGLENASVLFPAISAGTILASLLCGRFIFKEKLRTHHYLALAAGVLAVVFLKL